MHKHLKHLNVHKKHKHFIKKYIFKLLTHVVFLFLTSSHYFLQHISLNSVFFGRTNGKLWVIKYTSVFKSEMIWKTLLPSGWTSIDEQHSKFPRVISTNHSARITSNLCSTAYHARLSVIQNNNNIFRIFVLPFLNHQICGNITGYNLIGKSVL